MTAPALALDGAPHFTTYRIPAGVDPAPGAASRLPAWWSREDWLAEVAAALDGAPDVLRAHHVSRDAALAVARGMAAYADNRTGRDCRPTNDRLVAALRCSLSTVQRARRALKALGFVAVLVKGRSVMTRAERLKAWEAHSNHRRVAATFALCSRSPRLHLLVGSRQAPKRRTPKVGSPAGYRSPSPHPVDGDTPPGAPVVGRRSHLRSPSLRRRTENEEGGCAARSYRGERAAASRRLAERVRDRIGWLHGQSWRRLAPTLARFARAGWTERDVELAVRDALGARGWRVPRELAHPAAYLAGLLREVDPGLRPSVEADAHEAWLREQAAAERAARRAFLRAVRGECAHGVPDGGRGVPSRGVAPCADCAPSSGTIAE